MVVALVVGGTRSEPIVQALRGSETPHANCNPRSWCQPVEVSQEAQMKADLRARKLR